MVANRQGYEHQILIHFWLSIVKRLAVDGAVVVEQPTATTVHVS